MPLKSSVLEEFIRHDSSGNGKIRRDDLAKVLQSLPRPLPDIADKDIDDLLNYTDTAGDGLIDYAAFISWIFGTFYCAGSENPITAIQSVSKPSRLTQTKGGDCCEDLRAILRGRLSARELGVQTITPQELWRHWEHAFGNREMLEVRDRIRKIERVGGLDERFGTATPSTCSTSVTTTTEHNNLQELKFRLAAAGVHFRNANEHNGVLTSDSVRRSNAVEDLYHELMQGMSWLSDEGAIPLFRYIELVKVYVLAEVCGDQRCLIECGRFNLGSGEQQASMSAVQLRMRRGELWQDAMKHALKRKLGLELEWQELYLQVDLEKYIFSESEEPVHDYPGLKTITRLHEVSVRANMAIWTQQEHGIDSSSVPERRELSPFHRIGLPEGHNFVTREDFPDGAIELHVWSWRNRKHELNSKVKEFETYLTFHGVDTSQFGVGTKKSLYELYTEVKELRESSLLETSSDSSNGTVELLREVELINVRVEVELLRQRYFLTATEQFLDDGRRRKVNQLLVGKVAIGETWRDALPRTVSQRLGIDLHIQKECFGLNEDEVVYEEHLRWSYGYPLRSKYKTWTVTLQVLDPEHPDLEDIGLPSCSTFVSRDGAHGYHARGRLHVWAWEAIEENQGVVRITTRFETLCHDLADAENLVRQMSEHPSTSELGLNAPLGQTLEKIRTTLDKLGDIDEIMAGVDVAGMLRKSDREPDGDLLTEFINLNFTRNPTSKREKAIRHSISGGLSFDADACLDLVASSLQSIVDCQDDWGFDVFMLHAQTDQKALQSYGQVALAASQKTLGWSHDTTIDFLDKAASLYYSNTYHSAIHAAQVCHATRWLAREVCLMDFLTGTEYAGLMIATICHDVKHFGRNNAFCITSKHELALLYNDRSVLENMHAATTFTILQGSGGYLLAGMREKDQAVMRKDIVEYILSTDMTEHFEFISKLRVRQDSNEFAPAGEADRRLVARACLKAGDICHCALPWDLHQKWSTRVTQEFLEQGDEERMLGLPVSALCDRSSLADLGKSQRGFLEFVCCPLFEVFPCAKVDGDTPGQRSALLSPSSTRSRPLSASRSRSKMRWKRTQTTLRIQDKVQIVCAQQIRENASTWVNDCSLVQEVVAAIQNDLTHV